MKQFDTGRCFKLSRSLFAVSSTKGTESQVLAVLEQVKNFCLDFDLQSTLDQVGRLIEDLPTQSFTKIKSRLASIAESLQSEVATRPLLYLDEKERNAWTDPDPFELQGIAPFVSALHDARHASLSIAVGLYDSAVYYSMRVAEVGLAHICHRLGIVKRNVTWGEQIDEIEKHLKSTKDPDAQSATAHLQSIKNAWRNPVMHAQTMYGQKEATDIIASTRGFMRHVALL